LPPENLLADRCADLFNQTARVGRPAVGAARRRTIFGQIEDRPVARIARFTERSSLP
jgi:hypothetical protein